MRPTKAELRASLKQARLAMPPDDYKEKSSKILSKLKEITDWQAVKTVHCFEPIEKMKEVDIHGFLGETYGTYTSRRSGDKSGDNWSIVSVGGNDPIPEDFDVIIVPMLGFDKNLHRIGYGGGYYDRLLSTQPGAKKIGVCFEEGRVDQIPTEPHDIPLDIIITESGEYRR